MFLSLLVQENPVMLQLLRSYEMSIDGFMKKRTNPHRENMRSSPRRRSKLAHAPEKSNFDGMKKIPSAASVAPEGTLLAVGFLF